MKKFLLFLFQIILLFSFAYLLDKGCSRITGGDEARIIQIKQLKEVGSPPNSIFVEKFDSGMDFSRSWKNITYKTDLSHIQVIDFYQSILESKGWERVLSDTNNKIIYWKKMDYKFSLKFINSPLPIEIDILNNTNMLIYIVETRWKGSLI